MFKPYKFSFYEVLCLLNKKITPHREHGEVMTTCPCCGGTRFSVNLDKQVGHCLTATCSSGGRGLNAKQFYSVDRGISTDAAYHEIMSSLGYDNGGKGTEIRKDRVVMEIPKEAPIASVVQRELAYSQFLEELELEDEDYEELKSRGFTDETIAECGYKTFPDKGKDYAFALCRKLQSNGISLKGIPGFYQKNGDWTFVQATKGIIMPCKDAGNRIMSLQIRKRDNLRKMFDGELEAKCTWFSSKGREGGCSSGASVHFACDWIWKIVTGKDGTKAGMFVPIFEQPNENAKKGFALTEGFMKADLFHQFRPDIPVIAVPGVNALNQLKPNLIWLKKKGVEVILHCYDMDYQTNPNVEAAMKNTKELIQECGLEYKLCTWNTYAEVNGQKVDCLKGIDDYLAYKKAGIIPHIKRPA